MSASRFNRGVAESGTRSPSATARQTVVRAADRAARRARTRLAEDLERALADSGMTQSELARAAGVSASLVSRTLAGKMAPSIDTYALLAVPLGLDLATRLYPNTGPVIRDRHQARILEGVLERRHPRWETFTEVGVRAPARGWIDVVFSEQRERLVLATEIQSELRRLEQVVRWSEEKAASLPSWPGWAALAAHGSDPPAVSRLLLVRRTRTTRAVAAEFERQLRVAYPAHPDDAIAALTGTQAWPGPALVWVALEPGRVRLVQGR